MGLVDRYILRAVITPLIIALCIAGMLLLLEQMLRLFDFVLAQKGPIDVVWRMLANLVPLYLSLALPLGTFVGIMLAFRGLSLSSELDALNSSGASITRLMRPIYLLVIALMALDFLLVSYIQPFASYKYRQIKFDLTSGALGIPIPQGTFVDITDNVTIRLGKVNSKTHEVDDIYLEQRDARGGKSIITASHGSISTTPEISHILLKLRDGRQVFIDPAGQHANALSFDSFDVEVDLPSVGVFRARGGDEDESTLGEILRRLRAGSPGGDPLWYDFRAGLHWRIIHPLTFLVMPILAVAMGVTGRRRASNIKPVVGIAIIIVYHELLEEWGLATARAGHLSPYVSMWGLLAALLVVSIVLYRGSIDHARTTRVMARRDQEPAVRVLSPSGPHERASVDLGAAAQGPGR
ncbi:MAG: LptF/LptG family permease [Alphaproteobacteria bacterium]|nr:LptF/LptG family permease [Alphaproteobacteria bacterium]